MYLDVCKKKLCSRKSTPTQKLWGKEG